MRKRSIAIKTTLSVLILVLLMTSGCGANQVEQAGQEDTLYQVSTLNALMLGQYDGVIASEEFLKYGDTGLGTVDSLDGEMIILDGEAYQIKGDGTVHPVPGEETIPFGVVGKLDAATEVKIENPIDAIGDLELLLNEKSGMKENPNRIYMIRLDGEFSYVKTRSVPAQEKPYPVLSEVTANQNEFEFDDVTGTIIGVYFPDFLSDLNMHGWHMHFVSDDRSKGGHLLDAAVTSGTLYVDPVGYFNLLMPDTPEFAGSLLGTDLTEEIKSVESDGAKSDGVKKAELASSDAQYARLGLKRGNVEIHEDGTNTNGADGTYEWWYFDAVLEDDSNVVVTFYIRNPFNPDVPLAPFATLEWTKPDGTVINERVTAGAGGFSAAEDSCDVRINDCSFVGDLSEYEIIFKNENIEASIQLVSNTKAWRPETGYRLYGENEESFAAWLCAVPDGEVKVNIKTNEEDVSLSGSGYHDHNWGNSPIWEMQNNWYWGRAKTDSYVFIAFDVITAEEYGFKEFPCLMLAKDGEILIGEVEDVTFSKEDEFVDGKTGITIANKLIYNYDDGKRTFRVTFERENTILDTSTVRALSEDQKKEVAALGYKMNYYRFTGTATLEIFDGETLLEKETTDDAIWELMYPGQLR